MKLERMTNLLIFMVMAIIAAAGQFSRAHLSVLPPMQPCANPVLSENRLRCDGLGRKREFIKLLLGRKIDINAASAQDLLMLPSISTRVAERIIEKRDQLKQFNSVAELLSVKGIGEKTLAKICDSIQVSL